MNPNLIDRQYGYRRAEEARVRRLKTQTHEEWVWGLDIVHSVREPEQNIFRVAAGVQRVLRKHDVRFCFIGGVALQRWGETRATTDVDLTVFCDLGNEDAILATLQDHMTSRTDDIQGLARVARMFLGWSPEGVEVDVSLGFTPYEERMLERAVDVDFGVGAPLRICSPEDLLITKTVAGRGQDWVDIQRIIQRSGSTMDLDLVRRELAPLLELMGTPDHLERLESIISEHG